MTNEEKLILKWDSLTIKDNFISSKTMEMNFDLCRRLIVYVEDELNRSFDIEIQLTNNDDFSKRMRYYHSLIDLDKMN